MPEVLFFLGQTSDLCYAELEAALPRLVNAEPRRVSEAIASANLPNDVDFKQLQLELGGVVKTATVWDKLSLDASIEDVTTRLVDFLLHNGAKRFAVAEIGRDHLPIIDVYEIKSQLSDANHKASYHESPRYGVNAATWKHRKVTEVQVVQTAEGIFLGETSSAQDVDTWSQRDVEKPARDRKRGMLQPKLARMMFNLSLGKDGKAENQVVLDPFVGTGTVLLEAIDAGVPHVIGSDSDHTAILQTRQNLDWWKQESGQDFQDDLIVKTCENLQAHDFNTKPTVIITEPYLGRMTPRADKLDGVIRGLEKLYKGMFSAFARVLEPGSRVVVILPAWETKNGKERTVERTFTDLKEKGFVVEQGQLRAGRANAHTQRYVYVLKYDPYGTR